MRHSNLDESGANIGGVFRPNQLDKIRHFKKLRLTLLIQTWEVDLSPFKTSEKPLTTSVCKDTRTDNGALVTGCCKTPNHTLAADVNVILHQT